jgi:hypothetical protein
MVFHIGMGKTGTSAIQESLKNAIETLRTIGCDYWGLLLELAPVSLYGWQKEFHISEGFWKLAVEEANEQIKTVLEQSIQIAQEKGIHTAIWSQEKFFSNPHLVVPALKEIEAKGVHVKIIVYVRRHDSWSRSAYIQWGIKHKTYAGPLKLFRQLFPERFPLLRFSDYLQAWSRAFEGNVILRNYDACDDVVRDFLSALKIPEEIVPSGRYYETPGPEELLLRAIYNNNIPGEALPIEFEKHFKWENIDFNMQPSAWLKALLPTDDDLKTVVDKTSQDREIVNKMLEASGQPPLTVTKLPLKEYKIDYEKLVAVLIQLIYQQSLALDSVQKRLDGLAQMVGKDN